MHAAILLGLVVARIRIGLGQENDLCGALPDIPNANPTKRETTEYTVGIEVSYTCDFGYATEGTSISAKCELVQHRPQWVLSRSTCIPRSCGEPGFVEHAQRIGSRFTFPNDVKFECDEGYILKGPNQRFCQPNGLWSGRLPSCTKLQCGTPNDPENGRALYASLDYGSQLTYECDLGYGLETEIIRYCLEGSTWSGEEPLCVEKFCVDPEQPKHGSMQLLSGHTKIGSIVLYSCNDNRVLVGSATSKCHASGSWTFPTPQCIEPCTIPDIPNGKIGIYNYAGTTFRKLNVGTGIKENVYVHLRCDKSYRVADTSNKEVMISCRNGLWDKSLECRPVSCEYSPPITPNAHIKSADKRHGGGVEYTCNEGFRKTKYGAVRCNFGTWEGPQPECADTKCYFKNVNFPGLVPVKSVFNSGEYFVASCARGYKRVISHNTFSCFDGKWTSLQAPPCKADGCTTPVAPINGKVKSFGNSHGSQAIFECDQFYKLEETSKVQCNKGIWEGQMPVCKDRRCYTKDLQNAIGLNITASSVTYNRHRLATVCNDGYEVKQSSTPWCEDGKWVDNVESPCQEGKCTVVPFSNGDLTKEKSVAQGFSWRLFKVTYKLVYQKVPVGDRIEVGDTRRLSCISGYSIQGHPDLNNLPLTCKKGKWTPNIQCLQIGTFPVISTSSQSNDNNFEVLDDKVTTSVPPIKTDETEPSLDGKQGQNDPINNGCYCTYNNQDNNLVAYAGDELLEFNSKVKDGCKVKFHCKELGYARLRGNSELTCTGCRDWNIPEFPNCSKPIPGDTAIFFEKNYTVLPGGIVELPKGENIQMLCISINRTSQPVWHIYPEHAQLISNDMQQFIGTNVVYLTGLILGNTNANHNGVYECRNDGLPSQFIEIKVKEKCAEFENDDSLLVVYENNKAQFFCIDPKHKLVGPPTATCLPHAVWSEAPPKCEGPSCPRLTETQGLSIFYSNDQNIGSIASFECFQPYHLEGLPTVVCDSNGSWSGPISSCAMPDCTLEQLFLDRPPDVEPVMNDVKGDSLPYGTQLNLTCNSDNLFISGRATARCIEDGKWEFGSDVKCLAGCGPIIKPEHSTLIIDPELEFYHFGDSVAFYCLPGQNLTSVVERVLCLRGWLDLTVPDCV